MALKNGPRLLSRGENSLNASVASLFLWQQVVRVKTVAEIACLLQAVELKLQVWDKLGAIGLMHSLEKGVLHDGSPTGILQSRSYNPGEALRAVQVTGLLYRTPFLSQIVDLDGLPYHRRAV